MVRLNLGVEISVCERGLPGELFYGVIRTKLTPLAQWGMGVHRMDHRGERLWC